MTDSWESDLNRLTDTLEDLGYHIGVTLFDRDDGLEGPLMVNIIAGVSEEAVSQAAKDVAVKLGVDPARMLNVDAGKAGEGK